jgi:hypothetical protein
MKICLRNAARISAERLISVQTDMQTEIDMETNMAVNMGDKSVYIYGPSGLEKISQLTSQRSIQSNSLGSQNSECDTMIRELGWIKSFEHTGCQRAIEKFNISTPYQ